ncbi:Sensor protein FixL [Rubripirellula tenax]|uniref:Sensor protein FixL n=1 Tax=Rubripirellula tenax TaxID=2528015 RepID=A0A5C6EE99_9BACT|nr:PAS domain S-box protein [Rubripirellula tenax]TWU47352.1 Sensor protein FixL [Rubripirellula tenax]
MSTDEKLLESERRLRSVLEAVVDAIITMGENGLIESFNPAAERIFGYRAEEVIGENVKILMPDPYRTKHDDYLRHFRRTGEKKIIGIGREVEGRRKDGKIFPMDLAVSEVFLPDRKLFTGIIRDITDRKAAEAAIVESERRLSTLLGNLPGAAYRRWNDENWSFQFISDGCQDICGYTPDELVAGDPTWCDLIDSGDCDELREQVRDRLQRSLPFQAVYRIRHRLGEIRVVLEQGVGIFSDDGTLLAIEGFISDTTELQKAREKLMQSERLAAMGQMLSGIAHESRNALQRIQASVDMLNIEIAEDSEAAGDVAKIARARDDLQRLFEELRSFAAPIHLETSIADVSAVLQQAWSHLEATVGGREVQWNVENKDCDWTCRVDVFRIGQVFRNLIENSLAACSDPVRLDVLCEPTSLAGESAIAITFRDNGPGLTDEQKRRVFEAFFTTKTKGTGLGMAIAQRVVESHGGTLSTGTGDHDGAEFVVVLPRATPSDAAGF